ncbi:MAG: heme exporter protein CcmD [Rhizobiaceae bacterium]
MTHTFFVAAAYTASAVAIFGLIFWTATDHRGRKREMQELASSGIRRRSDRNAEPVD